MIYLWDMFTSGYVWLLTICRASLSMDNSSTLEQIRRHVYTLAGDIGERNVFHPSALQAAADYIGTEWRRQGYEVIPQPYQAKGVECMNLEVSRSGTVQPEEIILLGAHYDSVRGSPGADDNGSGVAALLELSLQVGHFPGVQQRVDDFPVGGVPA